MQNTTDVPQKHCRQITVSIIVCYTLLQILCLLLFGYTPYPDSNGYILLAQECVEHNTFYPVNLTDIPFLWNIGSINAVVLSLHLFNSVYPLLVLYCIMQGLSAWFVYDIAKHLFNTKTAFISLLLFVCYPANYACGTSVLSETPFIFFALFSIAMFLRGHHVTSGVVLAVANTFRPLALVFVMAILVYSLLRKKNCLAVLLGYVVITCSIGITNYIVKDKFFTQGAMGWMGLMQYSWDHDGNKDEDYRLFNGNDPNIIENENYDCLQRDSVWRSHFLMWISQNKMEYIKQMPEKVARTYISDNVNFCAFLPDKQNREYMYKEISMDTLKTDFPNYSVVQIVVILNLVYYYLLLITAIAGFCLSVARADIPQVVLPATVIIVGTLMLMLVGHGEARFHQPLMPMFILLSSGFFSSISLFLRRLM